MLTVDHERPDRHRHDGACAEFDVGQCADSTEMLRGQRLCGREHRGDRHPATLALGHQVVHRLRGEQLGEGLVEFA